MFGQHHSDLVRGIAKALELANNTEYGLTGAVFSNDPEKLERAQNEFFVGNLYLNRTCTGALVGVVVAVLVHRASDEHGAGGAQELAPAIIHA